MIPKKPNRFNKWFYFERFSYFDLILIFIGAAIFDWVLSHLTWS